MKIFNRKLKKLKEDVVANVKAYNNTITDEYIKKINVNVLINMAHPLDREKFEERYKAL